MSWIKFSEPSEASESRLSNHHSPAADEMRLVVSTKLMVDSDVGLHH